jgi:hypothetical protein
MRRRLIPFLIILALFGAAGVASAQCLPPDPPDTLPDGATATYDEMVAAHRAVKEFDEDVRAFTTCLTLEVKLILDDPSVDEETKEDLRRLLVQRSDEAIEEAEFVVGYFNEQLRAFRARGD